MPFLNADTFVICVCVCVCFGCSELQSKSLGLWSELEAECGTKLLDVNGLLFYGAADTGETVEGSIPGALEVRYKGFVVAFFLLP
jgi:hypothetical protein